MNQRITVYLARRRHEELGIVAKCKFEEIARPDAANIKGLDGEREIVFRRSRAREVHHGIDRSVDVARRDDITLHESECWVANEVSDVGWSARHVVVEADNLIATGQQGVDQMGTQKPGATCDNNAH